MAKRKVWQSWRENSSRSRSSTHSSINGLIQRAALEARYVYGGTVLGQALWPAIHGEGEADDVAILETLIGAGAKIEDGALAWLARREGRSASTGERIAEALRGYGAVS